MPVVLGTAGHIDHGKTSLVKRLTGTNCDRLQEESRRGITIELGFAFLDLPSGARLSIVDVPGHERFVHTMMAGAAGIDFVMLVVAADEGVMPQTREHMEICTLLGITQGIVALTKIDMVDPELRGLAEEDVAAFLQGTFLEGAPIFPVSSHTGEGIDALIHALDTLEAGLAPQQRSDLLRLPVDRVFTMRGHGTVVTGTLIGGTAGVGEEVMLYPSGKTAKVRSLQSHGIAADTGAAGRRTALNLQGIAVEDIQRGDVVAGPDTLTVADRWTVELVCLASSPRPLRHRREVHLHHGSRSVQARLYLPEGEALAPGERAIGEVRLQTPLPSVFGDRFVIRSFSPLQTVGGGIVVHPEGVDLRKKGRNYTRNISLLRMLAEDLHAEERSEALRISQSCPTNTAVSDTAGAAPIVPSAAVASVATYAAPPAFFPEASALERRVSAMLEFAGTTGMPFSRLRTATRLNIKVLEKLLALFGSKGWALCTDKEEKRYHGEEALRLVTESCVVAVEQYHAGHPMKQGVPRGELASGWGKDIQAKLLHQVVERLLKSGRLMLAGDMLHLPGHTVSMASDQHALREKILAAHVAGGTAPPNMKDVLADLSVTAKEAEPVIRLLQEQKLLTKVAEGIWYDTAALASIEDKMRAWFKVRADLDLAGLKEITGLSRKYLVALLEHFDREKITVRVGDVRRLRNAAAG